MVEAVSRAAAISNSDNAYINFIESIDSKYTKQAYRKTLSYFMKFIKIQNYDDIIKIDAATLESYIRDFIIYLREEIGLAPASIHLYIAALAHFCDMNDVTIRWKKLKKFKPKSRRLQDDKPYTREQIQRLLSKAGPRERAIILLMSSAGLRRGAIPLLRIGDLTPIHKYNIYKIRVYANEAEEYVTYCTSESKKAIDEYLEWRIRLGEQMKPDTPLFRKRFDSLLQINRPVPLTDHLISWTIGKLLVESGIREKQVLTESNPLAKRTDLMSTHALRKYFETTAKLAGLDSLYLQRLMGHDTGLEDSYFKPSEADLLEGNDKMLGYIGIANELQISEEHKLKQENKMLRIRGDQLSDLQNEVKHLRARSERFDRFLAEADELQKKITEGNKRLGLD
jgi:integrase